jgi:hypothetical protein
VPSTSEVASRRGTGSEATARGVGRDIRGGDQGAVGKRDTQEGSLRALRSDGLVVHASALITRLTDGAGVVRSEKRANDELAGLDVSDRTADRFDDAAIFVATAQRAPGVGWRDASMPR